MSTEEKPFIPHDVDIPEVDTEISDIKDIARRTAEVDRMYAKYVEVMSKPIIIPYSTFQKYEVLFTVHALQEVEDVNGDKYSAYSDLLFEFIKLLGNTYKEYHVRMPDGNLVTFPPLLTPVSNIGKELVDSVDVFTNIQDKCKDQPWKRREATAKLLQALYESQNVNIINNQRAKTKTIMSKMKEQVSSTARPTKTEEHSSEVLNDMEFVLDD